VIAPCGRRSPAATHRGWGISGDAFACPRALCFGPVWWHCITLCWQAERTRETTHDIAQMKIEMAAKDSSLKQMEEAVQSLRQQVFLPYSATLVCVMTAALVY